MSPSTRGLRSSLLAGTFLAAAFLAATVVVLLVASTAPVGATAPVAATGDLAADGPPEHAVETAQAVETESGRTTAVGATVGAVGAQAAESCAQTPPPDHADPEGSTSDVVGWVDGYWYDEPVAVDESDGLNATERERVTARAAARVETIRCATFDALPPVEVQTRAEYGEMVESELENESERAGELLSAKAGSMLLVGDDENWADVQAAVLTAGVGAYYDPETEEISMLVADADDVPREEILAHELVHALQDQRHDLDRFDASLQSRYDAQLGVIEGEATLVQEQYAEQCDSGEWQAPCTGPATVQTPDLPENRGVLLLFQQPYLYGPNFVERQRDAGGWDAVGDLYDDMPEHSVHVVDPETYGTLDVTLPEVEDRSSEEWERVTAEGRPDYEVVGQAALTTMFVAPAIDPRADGSVVHSTALLDATTGRLSGFDQPETSGWRGDRLVAYSDGEDVASVWALEWENGTEAERFHDAYADLLEAYGAEAVDDADGVYAFDDESRFDRAVSLQVEGDRVLIVTAPTVEALSAVHDVGETDGDGDGDSDGLPGPGLVGAALALLVAALVLVRRS